MSERPSDADIPAAKKKRGSEKQITKDDEESEEEEVVDPGNFQRASEDVLKSRKIVKARRGAGGGAPAGGASANPFAGISLRAPAGNPLGGFSLVPPSQVAPAMATAPADAPQDASAEPAKPEGEGKPAEDGNAGAAAPPATEGGEAAKEDAAAEPAAAVAAKEEPAKPAFPSFGTGGGFGAFSGSGFAAAAKTGTGFGSLATSSAPFSFSTTAPATGAGGFAFAAASSDAAASTNDAQPVRSLFGGGAAGGAAPAAAALGAAEDTITGEENEECVYSAEGMLFEYDAGRAWRERGRGEMRVNVGEGGRARLVMRNKGNLRLLMNANLWPEMVVTKMDGGKAITFAVLNAAHAEEGEEKKEAAAQQQLATYAFRCKPADKLEQFLRTIEEYKAGSGAAGHGENAAAPSNGAEAV